MGNCCLGRDDAELKLQAAKLEQERRTATAKNNAADPTWDFLKGEKVTTDIDKFDAAHKNNDIETFVSLIKSTEKIGAFKEEMHPWAADPKTVGALATTQIAILAARTDMPEYRERIREAGGIPIMTAELSSPEEDRVHAAAVALSFLSVDNPRNCIDIFKAGGLPHMIQGMNSTNEGMRGTCAQCCRNIYVLGRDYREEFKRLGGLQALVNSLSVPENFKNPEELFNQLEAIYHIEDFIMESGEELVDYMVEVKRLGVVEKLEKLIEVGSAEIKEAAQFLRVRLAD